MIRGLAQFFSGIMQRWLPDAFIFAIALTFVVLMTGILVEGHSPNQMVSFWGGGVWNLLTFSMQVSITLVTGSVLAQTAPIKKALRKLASLANTPSQAIMLMTVLALICCWISWGFGLIASALLAREIARQVKGIHYPLLVASAYSGMLIWHAGLSGSIPLKIAVAGDDVFGSLMGGVSIPLTETIFSWQVMLIAFAVLVTLPIINRMMMPRQEDIIEIPPQLLNPAQEIPVEGDTPAERIEHSRFPTLLLGLMGGWFLLDYIIGGGVVGLNTVNFCFLTLGLLLHRSPAAYLHALNEAISGVAGIILQFPLYAGIMGMMVQSGLAVTVSEWFVSISTETTFTLFTFLSAGVVNFFVPSGGGQWAVQAPIVIPAAEALGVPLNKAAMAVAFGDAWTNMVQPLWALPLLGIAGLGIRDIMGYCTVALLWSGLIFALGMLFLL